MFPGRAYCVTSPGVGWTEVDYRDVSVEGDGLSEDEFWTEFSGWRLPGFPPEFTLLERRPEHFRPVRTRTRRLSFL
jgi:hypothetical protein